MAPTPPGIPKPANGPNNADWAECLAAALTLVQITKKARQAAPALVEALTDDDRPVRTAAVLALGDSDPDAVRR
jgi:HEAT repeat protein